MQELLYLEIPHPDTAAVLRWLREEWQPPQGTKEPMASGVKWQQGIATWALFLWSVQRTTYLKVFQWSVAVMPQGGAQLQQLQRDLTQRFPQTYPVPPLVGEEEDIFTALAPHYPKTVAFFRKFPQGVYDLRRVYWWEQRWRDQVQRPTVPAPVVTEITTAGGDNAFDLIYLGGALGAIHAAVMAQRGYRVLLIERTPFARMNREWNISRDELQTVVRLGLFTQEEVEDLIAREYRDGFNKFFDGNNPPHLKAAILHTPTVLNLAIASEKLLRACGDRLIAGGGAIWDRTEFLQAEVDPTGVTVAVRSLASGEEKTVRGRLLVDAMGTTSPIAWQLNNGRPFNSVCPTVGAVIDDGFPETVWDPAYGDVLNSHGDISRGRQLIWELFPGPDRELTFYLFHYHEIHPDNPGSLLEMYEDFFTILPEYRQCDMDSLVWKKATFGYIPGHFTVGSGDRTVAFNRLIAIGDAASLQSPLVFTGFGSLVRNLERLTGLLDHALGHDLLDAASLNQIRAYQSNTAVTWLFSKGMMVPTGKTLPPQRVNAMLNTFFGLLADEPPAVADTFIKDRTTWLTFNRLALKAARRNPALLWWIWEMAGWRDITRWLGAYFVFTLDAILGFLLGWLPAFLHQSQPWLPDRFPRLWLLLQSWRYRLAIGTGRGRSVT